MAAVAGAGLRAVGQHLVVTVEQPFLEHLLQRPPRRLDVVVVECHVRVVHVDPERHALGHLAPCLLVSPDALPAGGVELLDAVILDFAVCSQTKCFLHLDFDR